MARFRQQDSGEASAAVGILLLAGLRRARGNGPRQGIAVWPIGLLVTIVLAVAGADLGTGYDVQSSLQLPRIPVGEGSPMDGGLIALTAVGAGTLSAAIAGGKAGTHFHRQADPVGLAQAPHR